MESEKSAGLKLFVFLGGLSGLIYLGCFLLPFPLFRHYQEPLQDLGKLTGHTYAWGGLYLGAVTALFLAYIKALGIVVHGHVQLRLVLVFALLFTVTLFFVYPWGAADIYDYILNAKILAHYHANPFAVRGDELANEPWLVYAPWSDTTVAYGPLWVILAGLAFQIAGSSLLANLLVFKASAWLFYWIAVIAVILVWRKLDRTRIAIGALLFAWNPLVLLETLANGHNDIMMAAFILIAVYLFLRDRRSWALVALAAASSIKFASALLAPILILANLRGAPNWSGKVRRAFVSVLAFLFPALILWLPFWRGADPLALGRRAQMFTTSLPALTVSALQTWTGPTRAKAISQGMASGLLAAFILYQGINTYGSVRSLIRASYEMLFFYLVFACSWFQPWYLVWLVGLGALCLERPCWQRTLLFSYSGLWNYFIFAFLWFWGGLYAKPPALLQLLAVTVIIAPPALLWLWQLHKPL